VTRVMTLGVIEPSDALASTNFVVFAKKTKDARKLGAENSDGPPEN
jgi:hypothetical protein